MSDPSVATDPRKMAKFGREHTSLREIVRHIDEHLSVVKEIADLKELITLEGDADLVEMAKEE